MNSRILARYKSFIIIIIIKFFTFSPNPEMSPQIDNWVTLLHLTKGYQYIVKIMVCKDKSEANFLNKFSKKQHMHEVYHQMPSCFVNKVWSDSKLCS